MQEKRHVSAQRTRRLPQQRIPRVHTPQACGSQQSGCRIGRTSAQPRFGRDALLHVHQQRFVLFATKGGGEPPHGLAGYVVLRRHVERGNPFARPASQVYGQPAVGRAGHQAHAHHIVKGERVHNGGRLMVAVAATRPYLQIQVHFRRRHQPHGPLGLKRRCIRILRRPRNGEHVHSMRIFVFALPSVNPTAIRRLRRFLQPFVFVDEGAFRACVRVFPLGHNCPVLFFRRSAKNVRSIWAHSSARTPGTTSKV